MTFIIGSNNDIQSYANQYKVFVCKLIKGWNGLNLQNQQVSVNFLQIKLLIIFSLTALSSRSIIFRINYTASINIRFFYRQIIWVSAVLKLTFDTQISIFTVICWFLRYICNGLKFIFFVKINLCTGIDISANCLNPF